MQCIRQQLAAIVKTKGIAVHQQKTGGFELQSVYGIEAAAGAEFHDAFTPQKGRSHTQ